MVKTVKNAWFKFVPVVAASFLWSGCSLLKISADFGMEPLPRSEVNARVQVRLYAANFTETVSRAADTIFSRSADPLVKLNSIRWKQNATAACMIASLSSVPAGTVVNTWVVVKGMDGLFCKDTSFAEWEYVARDAAGVLRVTYETLVRGLVPASEYKRMEHFVDSILAAEPPTADFITKDYTYAWFRHRGVPDSLIVRTVGSIAQVIADLNDRVAKYTSNVTNQLNWTKDKIELQLSAEWNDSTYKAGLDSLNHALAVFKDAVRQAPGTVDSLARGIQNEMNDLLSRVDYTVNSAVGNTMRQVDSQRTALQKYVTAERTAIMAESRDIIQKTVSEVSAAVPKVIGKVLIYMLIFVLLLLGIPFYIGYRMGRSRGSKSMGKE